MMRHFLFAVITLVLVFVAMVAFHYAFALRAHQFPQRFPLLGDEQSQPPIIVDTDTAQQA